MDRRDSAPEMGAPSTLSEADLACLLNLSLKSIRNRRVLGDTPAYIRVSRSRVVYLSADVEAYLLARRIAGGDSQVAPRAPAATPVATTLAAAPRGRGHPKGAVTRNHRRGEG
ncbi:hypothetical protein [Roseomonas genomospecies 6]|uniref:Uncharacterized protein n=1 Tax=Roseomonas genomospecies 6 TaxID=214106 RepID=A0A9W7NLD6_9PROT|nr:hypothetical protein [Roseomonas genomospecies 6]KAA0682200.1 hypothetical protein DS843_06550 [Roseomonas genomospecies 6]